MPESPLLGAVFKVDRTGTVYIVVGHCRHDRIFAVPVEAANSTYKQLSVARLRATVHPMVEVDSLALADVLRMDRISLYRLEKARKARVHDARFPESETKTLRRLLLESRHTTAETRRWFGHECCDDQEPLDADKEMNRRAREMR